MELGLQVDEKTTKLPLYIISADKREYHENIFR